MDRRTSIAAYDYYNLGDEAKSEHIDLSKTNDYAAYEVKKLDVGDNVFVRRSYGQWGFAVLVEKSNNRDGNVYTYQIGQNRKFKSLRENQLGNHVRLVEVVNQKASYPKLDIDQSLSCESYTNKVVQPNHQKQSRRGTMDTKSTCGGGDEDKENLNSMRSVAISQLSMSSPVENVMKQRRSLGATQLVDTAKEAKVVSTGSRVEEGSQPNVPTSISTRKRTSYSSMSSRPKLSSPSALWNAIEEQHDHNDDDYDDEELSILNDLIMSETLLKDGRSEANTRRSINNQLPTNQTSVSSVSRSSLPASSSRWNNSRGSSARRQSLASESQNDSQSRMIIENVRQRAANSDDNDDPSSFNSSATVESDTADAAKPKGDNNFNDAWREKSDPEIVFVPSDEEKDAIKSNFNTANWRAKSDQEILFMPVGEEENNNQESEQISGQKTSNANTSSASTTALVLHPTSIQQSSAGEKDSVNKQKRPSNEKKRRRNVFSGATKFFAKKFRKKDSPEKIQRNSAKILNGKGLETANQSSSENSRPSEPHYSQSNPSGYAATVGIVPSYYPNQNVYYVSDPRLAQAYRDYAQHVIRTQASQCVHNQSTYDAQYFNAHMANYPTPYMQPNTQIRVGVNGHNGSSYRMTSIGHGIQIGMPMNSANVMHLH